MSDSADNKKVPTNDNFLVLDPDLSVNYFQLLGLKDGYTISLSELEKAYLKLQRKIHPDQFTNNTNGQLVAVQYSSFINKAYETLRSPLLRAQYLLDLYGITADIETATTNDHDFLMEQIDLRETLEEIKETENPHQGLKNLMQDINDKIDDLQNQFNILWKKRENGSLVAAIPVLQKMYFFHKLMKEARAEEERLLGI